MVHSHTGAHHVGHGGPEPAPGQTPRRLRPTPRPVLGKALGRALCAVLDHTSRRVDAHTWPCRSPGALPWRGRFMAPQSAAEGWPEPVTTHSGTEGTPPAYPPAAEEPTTRPQAVQEPEGLCGAKRRHPYALERATWGLEERDRFCYTLGEDGEGGTKR